MGINPIEYRPWKGERTAQNLRMYMIARHIAWQKVRTPGVIVLLVLGFLFVHTLYLILVIIGPHERADPSDMSNYLGSGAFATFAMLLAAIVTSDLISEDLSSSSFVLYFSRALKVGDYLVGKTGAALIVMSLLCFFPPIAVAFVSMATQSGGDYAYSLGVVGKTVLVGVLMTVFFVPFGMMISSFTKRKSYAAVGTFMSFFVLALVAGVFSEFSQSWRVISPIDSLSFLFGWLFEGSLPSYIDGSALLIIVASMMLFPAAIVYMRVTREVVGR